MYREADLQPNHTAVAPMKFPLSLKRLRHRLNPAMSLGLLLTSLPLGISSPVQAEEVSCSSQWAEDAITYLEAELGFKPPFTFCFEVEPGATEYFYITADERDLRMSTNHLIVAECDRDCNDVDLNVYDNRGRLIGSDTGSSSYAEVRWDNIYVGEEVLVEIGMYDCDAEFCGVVLGTMPTR